ncbi:hypothetical protein MASR1M60_09790 [Rhodocyclaceae bacterium]
MALLNTGGEPGPLQKLLALLVGATLLILGFMFSVVVLAIVVVLGAIGFGYFWWKTRALRKAMRERPPEAVFDGDTVIIDGEARVIEGELLIESKPVQEAPIQH